MTSNRLTLTEQETIIRFSKGEPLATVYTYEKRWIRRLEQDQGLKPTAVNSHGGRTYELDKRLIPMPRMARKPQKLSDEQKTALKKKFANGRRRVRENSPSK